MRFIVANPLRQNRMLTGAAGVRARPRRRAPRARRVPRRVDRVARRPDRGRRGRTASGPTPTSRTSAEVCRKARLTRRRRRARRRTRAVPRARPDRGRGDLDARGGLPRRGGRARRAPCPARRRRRRSTRSTSSSGAPRRASASRSVEPRPIRTVGIVGAGLMATQLATLFLRRLEVPVVITDVDPARVEQALAADPRRARGAR